MAQFTSPAPVDQLRAKNGGQELNLRKFLSDCFYCSPHKAKTRLEISEVSHVKVFVVPHRGPIFFFTCVHVISSYASNSISNSLRDWLIGLPYICLIFDRRLTEIQEFQMMYRLPYGSRQSQQPENVSFEPILRGIKSDIFEFRPSAKSVSYK